MTAARLLLLLAVLQGACATHPPKPDTYDARKELATEMARRAEWADAFRLVQRLLSERPDDAQVLALRGIIYRDQGLRAEALADLREAVRLEPKLAAAHSALAILYDGEGEGEAALEHHRRAAELEPKNAAYLNNLAYSLFVHGQARDAIGVYQQALRLDPLNPRLRNNLGFAYAKTGDFRSAALQFERGGTPAEARNNLGFAYERGGNLAQAFEEYAEAARLDPGLARARANLEHVAHTMGRPLPPDLAAVSAHHRGG